MIQQDVKWLTRLNYTPLTALMKSGVTAIELQTLRTFFDEDVSLGELWNEPEVHTLTARQLNNGAWKYPTKQTRASAKNYNQYQTFKNLSTLIEKYGLNKKHSVIQKAAEYLFSCQTDEGDFRGIYDKQYTPNYTAAIAELLIKAGYQDDARVEQVFKWLLAVCQQDGGWALPFRTQGYNIDVTYSYPETIQPDLTQPFSHMITGVVLRAFAIHPGYRHSPEAKRAGELLADSLFKRDNYPDRGNPKYWLQFTFPFCYTDLISSLDSLSLLGFSAEEPQIKRALQWFVDSQTEYGIWHLKITAGGNSDASHLWLALTVCKVFKQYYG